MSKDPIDLDYLKGVCNGDGVRMQRYINMYLQSAPSLFDQMAQQCQSGDAEALSRTAHGLKPQATYMGANELVEKLKELELQAKNEGTGACKDLLDQCAQLNAAVIGELQSALDQTAG